MKVGALQLGAFSNPTPLENIKIILKNAKNQILKLQALPDTGANVIAVSTSNAKKIEAVISQGGRAPQAEDGRPVQIRGQTSLEITHRGTTMEANFIVMDQLPQTILSREMLKKLKLLHPEFPHVQVVASLNKKESIVPKKMMAKKNVPKKLQNTSFEKLAEEYADIFNEQCQTMKGNC